MIAIGSDALAHNHCNWTHKHCNGIAINPAGTTLIAIGPGRETIAIQSFDWRSDRQTGGQHLLLQFARAVRAEFLLEECSNLARFDAEHLGQHLGRVPMRVSVASTPSICFDRTESAIASLIGFSFA